MIEELQALAIAFVSLGECIDATTLAGKLQMHILGAIAEFERAYPNASRLVYIAPGAEEAVGLAPGKAPATRTIPGGSVCAAAQTWGVSKSTAARWIAAGRKTATSMHVA